MTLTDEVRSLRKLVKHLETEISLIKERVVFNKPVIKPKKSITTHPNRVMTYDSETIIRGNKI